jgi:hypothetical protein
MKLTGKPKHLEKCHSDTLPTWASAVTAHNCLNQGTTTTKQTVSRHPITHLLSFKISHYTLNNHSSCYSIIKYRKSNTYLYHPKHHHSNSPHYKMHIYNSIIHHKTSWEYSATLPPKISRKQRKDHTHVKYLVQ